MGEAATPRLVLASGSPRRAALLARLGWAPELRPADIDESVQPGEPPHALVVRLARTKAATVAAGRDDEVVLGADTEVALDGRVLGKPRDDADAATMLRSLAGRTHEVVTGLAVMRGGTAATDLLTTRVTFRTLTAAEVAWYVGTGEPAGKAGGYALQGAGAALVDRVDGSDTNVIGLPLAAAIALVRTVGLDLLGPAQPASR
ncbi:MAG: Maf family protein [Nitriliruptoraceae bacterium]